MTPIIQLQPTHLGAVIALHRRVIADFAPELVAAEPDVFFERHIDEIGRIFGAFEDDSLIAYGVLGLPGDGDQNFGEDHDLSPQDLLSVAHIDGAAVDPCFRGQGWQLRMICHRLSNAFAHHRKIALSTAAPGNIASVINLLAAGMEIRGLKQKFGGDRFLFRRDLPNGYEADGKVVDEDLTCWCPVTDTVQSTELLASGYVGVSCQIRTVDGMPEIGWVKRYCM